MTLFELSGPHPYLCCIVSRPLYLLCPPESTRHPVTAHTNFYSPVWYILWACRRQVGEASCGDQSFSHIQYPRDRVEKKKEVITEKEQRKSKQKRKTRSYND